MKFEYVLMCYIIIVTLRFYHLVIRDEIRNWKARSPRKSPPVESNIFNYNR